MGAYILPGGHVRCFECRYDLSGLPDRGCCPECGNAYSTITPRYPITAEDVAEALRQWPRNTARVLWDKYAPSSRTVTILICVLGTSAVVIAMGFIALNTFYDRIHKPW